MKKITLLMFVMLSVSMVSQELSTKEISKIRSLEIDVQKLNLQNTPTQLNLRAILKLDKKRSVNKGWAIGFTTFAAVFVAAGIKGIYDSRTTRINTNSHNFGEVLGGLVIGMGGALAGASIPFWIATNKRKKQRDKLLKKYQ